jgi:hypothetical protein
VTKAIELGLLNPHLPINEQLNVIGEVQALDLGWYMSAATNPSEAIGPSTDPDKMAKLSTLYDATPHEMKVVMRELWTVMLKEGVSADEFDRRYPRAKAQKDSGGPDLDWYNSLDIEARFTRLLADMRTRHTWATGKTHDPVGYYWLEDDDSPDKIERFTREVNQIPEKTLDHWRKNEPDQLREEYRNDA